MRSTATAPQLPMSVISFFSPGKRWFAVTVRFRANIALAAIAFFVSVLTRVHAVLVQGLLWIACGILYASVLPKKNINIKILINNYWLRKKD
jgi:hypothetical protein